MPEVSAIMLRDSAINLLAQRDYSRSELSRKLKLVSDDGEQVEEVLAELESERLLSEHRMAENFIRSRISKGHGAMRITQDLRQKGVDASVIALTLDEADIDWSALAEETRQKKFGAALPPNPKEKAKQIRFLQYRGYPVNIVMELF